MSAKTTEVVEDGLRRCPWGFSDTLMRDYHDKEWGKPCHDERRLFEMLILEGMQAGLSWATILRKRDAFRRAFDGFEPAVIARYDEEKVDELMQNAGIIRNRLKVNSTIVNAQAYLKLCEMSGSFDAFLWAYVDGKPVVNDWESLGMVPVTTPLSDKISKDMSKLGFKFVGSTIIYSYMQAIGLVNDHLIWCHFRGV